MGNTDLNGLSLVADDLTGALDAAARFTGAFGPITVHLDPAAARNSSGNRACVVPTRDASPDEALAMTGASLAIWDGASTAFKKIDSLLRGHWAAEIGLIVRSGQFDVVILAPAFPAAGRLVLGGRVRVATADGQSTMLDVDMAAALRQYGVTAELVPEPRALQAGRAPVLIADATDEDAMRALVEAGRQLGGRMLWCGSAGLAGALAGLPPKRPPRLRSPLVALVGSNHPVMRSQLHALEAQGRMAEICATTDSLADAEAINGRARMGEDVLTVFEPPAGFHGSQAAEWIDSAITKLVPALQPPVSLFVSGGDTLLTAVLGVKASSLTVIGEAMPGIPVSIINGGNWNGTQVISKSGAFGEPDTLVQLFDKLVK